MVPDKGALSNVKMLPDQDAPKHQLKSGRWEPGMRLCKGVPDQALSSLAFPSAPGSCIGPGNPSLSCCGAAWITLLVTECSRQPASDMAMRQPWPPAQTASNQACPCLPRPPWPGFAHPRSSQSISCRKSLKVRSAVTARPPGGPGQAACGFAESSLKTLVSGSGRFPAWPGPARSAQQPDASESLTGEPGSTAGPELHCW